MWSFRSHKKKLFNPNIMKDLFGNVNIDDILSLLREIKLYQKYKRKPDQFLL